MELEDTVVISTQISRVVELETQKHYVMAGSEAEGAISRVYSKARFITSILIIYDLSIFEYENKKFYCTNTHKILII